MKKIQSRIFKLSVIFLIVSLFGLYFEKGTGKTVWGQVSEDKNAEENTGTESDAVKMNLEDGEYSIQVDLEEAERQEFRLLHRLKSEMGWRMQNFSGAVRIMTI